MIQQDLEAFCNELTALCKKHNMVLFQSLDGTGIEVWTQEPFHYFPIILNSDEAFLDVMVD